MRRGPADSLEELLQYKDRVGGSKRPREVGATDFTEIEGEEAPEVATCEKLAFPTLSLACKLYTIALILLVPMLVIMMLTVIILGKEGHQWMGTSFEGATAAIQSSQQSFVQTLASLKASYAQVSE